MDGRTPEYHKRGEFAFVTVFSSLCMCMHMRDRMCVFMPANSMSIHMFKCTMCECEHACV